MTTFAGNRLLGFCLLVSSLAFATGCITADATLDASGGATVSLTFPTVATASDDKAARTAVTAPGVTIESITIVDAAAGEKGPRRATARLKTDDVTKMGAVPLLVGFGTKIERTTAPDGGGKLRVAFSPIERDGANTERVKELSAYTASFRAHMPGPVLETSGTKTDDGASWSFSAGDWPAGKLPEMTASYGPAKSADTE